MRPAILSTLMLLSSPLPVARPAPTAVAPPGLVEPESGAWAVIDADAVWVCWSPGPGCFERIELADDRPDGDAPGQLDDGEALLAELDADAPTPDSLGTERWRMGFWGPRTLWLERGRRWFRVEAGQRRAQASDAAPPLRLQRAAVPVCGPAGVAPARVAGQLGWREVPRCAVPPPRASTCVAPARARARPRRPPPVRLRFGVEAVQARGWTARATGLAQARPQPPARGAGHQVELWLFTEIGVEPLHRHRQRLAAQAGALARAHPRTRSLPPVGDGPLAAAELEALTRVMCGGQP